jgi:hypothetical protein
MNYKKINQISNIEYLKLQSNVYAHIVAGEGLLRIPTEPEAAERAKRVVDQMLCLNNTELSIEGDVNNLMEKINQKDNTIRILKEVLEEYAQYDERRFETSLAREKLNELELKGYL